MKKFTLLMTIILGTIVFFSACTEEEELIADPAERLLGTWKIESASVLGITLDMAGSTVTFNACGDTNCKGSDYVSSDDVNFPFVYTLSDTNLTIEYPDQEAVGDFTGDWKIDSFTNSSLNLGMSTLFGPMSYKLKK